VLFRSKCGYAIEPENIKEFADALESASENRAELKEMGIKSKALAIDAFSRKNLADEWVEWVCK